MMGLTSLLRIYHNSLHSAKHYRTASLDFPIPYQNSSDLTITVTGAATGDAVVLES